MSHAPDRRSTDPAPGGETPAESAAEDESRAEAAPTGAEPVEDWATRYKYLLADFENFRRRTERERENLTQQLRARLLRDLLPIYEAFHFARDAVNRVPANDPVRQGLDLLHREWQTFLKHEGVEPVAEVGELFHSDLHEAVGEAPTSPERPDGSVAEVVQQGYRFFGGLLRPAKVIVARDRHPPPESQTPAANEESPRE